MSLQKTGEKAETVGETADDTHDLYEREEQREETLQLVVFRLAREWYGVDIKRVREVIKLNKVTYLPSCPDHIAGIVNLRGNILSVTDLKAFLNLPREEPSEKTRIIAVESGVLETGFLVDEAVGSIELPVKMITPVIPTIPAEGARYLEGQCKLDDKFIGILSVEKVLEERV